MGGLWLRYAARDNTKRTSFDFNLNGQAGLLLSVRAAISLLLLSIILPAFNAFMLKSWNFSAEKKDIWLARISIILVIFGCIGIGVSNYSFVMIIGKFFPYSYRSMSHLQNADLPSIKVS